MTTRPASIDRRDALRAALLALAVAGSGGVVSACASEQDPPPRGDGPSGAAGDIELVSSEVKRAAGDPTLLAEVVAGLQAFAGGLYAGVAAEPGNVVLSPYSVLVALGMTLTGAAGPTATEMREVLGAEQLGERWHRGVNALTAYVDGLAGEQKRSDDSTAEIAIATANQLFGQRGVRWEQDFLDLLAREYGAGLRAVDFETAAEPARVLINDWVEAQTNDRIEDLVPEGVLDQLTRLVLVNAIYLKAPWEVPFEKELTEKGAFRREDGTSVEVDLMRSPTLAGALGSGEGWRCVVLPYAGRRMAMTIVLPDEGALATVEQDLAQDGFAGLTADLRPTAVDLSLPRWTFRAQASLKDLLVTLGMPTAFGEGPGRTDFTPMTEEDLDLVISHVLHQGFIAVDEEGTEAAAATAVVMRETSAPVAEPFVVDRPFLFLIHDLEHGTPLFVGRVADPTAVD